jgi:alpha-L-rhamnosidase
MNWLDVWRNNIKMGLTTWAEISDLEHNRSDCHAWGASPNIEFFRTVLGIDSYAPGFSKVKIEPHLGKMENASGEIPHPMVPLLLIMLKMVLSGISALACL